MYQITAWYCDRHSGYGLHRIIQHQLIFKNCTMNIEHVNNCKTSRGHPLIMVCLNYHSWQGTVACTIYHILLRIGREIWAFFRPEKSGGWLICRVSCRWQPMVAGSVGRLSHCVVCEPWYINSWTGEEGGWYNVFIEVVRGLFWCMGRAWSPVNRITSCTNVWCTELYGTLFWNLHQKVTRLSFQVTWHRWRLHHSICRTREPHAAHKYHGSTFDRTWVTADGGFTLPE